jgi:hypothetical protein
MAKTRAVFSVDAPTLALLERRAQTELERLRAEGASADEIGAAELQLESIRDARRSGRRVKTSRNGMRLSS